MRIRNEAGLTLVEILIAIMIFAVGVLGIAIVFPQGMNRVTDATGDTRASELASERCELVLGTPYDDVTLEAGAHSDPDNPRDGLYNVSWNVEVDQPLAACKRVTVSVTRPGEARPRARLMVVNVMCGS
jgi:type IV pilus assembly protein PilV